MLERLFAAIVLAACVLLLVRLLIGERRRYRFDNAMRRAARQLRRIASSLRHWRASRRNAAQAAEAANDAIRRASGRDGEWDGNVYKPKSLRKPPRDKMH